MRKGQRPSRHTRTVWTRQGWKRVWVNPEIRRPINIRQTASNIVTSARKTYDAYTKAKEIVDYTLQAQQFYTAFGSGDEERIKNTLTEFVVNTTLSQYPAVKAARILAELLSDPSFVDELRRGNVNRLVLHYGPKIGRKFLSY
ncbi:hypothetical protein HYY74_01085 [Candidatus Woesearchaeota archaeon]|nr:hypothetical protein [Candidatus Woesearchaeota archaeon]